MRDERAGRRSRVSWSPPRGSGVRATRIWLQLLLAAVVLSGCTAGQAETPRENVIVAIGDSLVDAVGWNGVTDTSQWLRVLLANLGETSVTPEAYAPPSTPTTPNNALVGGEWTALNLGVSGQLSSQVLARFDADVPRDAEFVIMQVGLNDIFYGVPLVDVEANLGEMCDKARTLGAIPVLCTLPPSNASSGASLQVKDDIETLNAWIRDYGASERITVSDWYEALVTDPVGRESSYLTPDGIHPNDAGSRVVGDLLAESIKLSE